MVGIQPIVRAAQQVSAEFTGPPLTPSNESAQLVVAAFKRFAQLLSVAEPFVGDVVNKPTIMVGPDGEPSLDERNDLLREAAGTIQALRNRVGLSLPVRDLSRHEADQLDRLVHRLNQAAQ